MTEVSYCISRLDGGNVDDLNEPSEEEFNAKFADQDLTRLGAGAELYDSANTTPVSRQSIG